MLAASKKIDFENLENDDQSDATLGRGDINVPYNDYTCPVRSQNIFVLRHIL